jgi:hypothetical protein
MHGLSRSVYRTAPELLLNRELCSALRITLGNRYTIDVEYGMGKTKLDIAIENAEGNLIAALEGKCFCTVTDSEQYKRVLRDFETRKPFPFPVYHVLWILRAETHPAKYPIKYQDKLRRKEPDDPSSHVKTQLQPMGPADIVEFEAITSDDSHEGFKVRVVPFLVIPRVVD